MYKLLCVIFIINIQVIATNNWCQSNSFENRCYSNWSRPLEINTTMAQIVNEKFENTVTPTTTSTVLNSGTIEVTPSTSVDNTRGIMHVHLIIPTFKLISIPCMQNVHITTNLTSFMFTMTSKKNVSLE